MSLPNLPAEVMHMILEALAQDGRDLASFIEPQTFRRIKVTPPRIAQLNDMTRRNRSHVRYLWLCVELKRYDCHSCSFASDIEEIPMFIDAADDLPIKTAIQALFSVLSTWDSSSSLTLDMSVYSTSDREHWFKYLTFEPDDDEDDGSSSHGYSHAPRFNQAVSRENGDAQHHWDTTVNGVFKAQDAVLTVFTRILDSWPDESDDEETETDDLEWWRELPLVPAITRLLLRQQTRRRWVPEALRELLARFPRLCELHFEPWREWHDMLQMYKNAPQACYRTLLESPSIRRLRKLSIFENFNQRYMDAFWDADCSRIRPPNPTLGQILSEVCGNLEFLSASFMLDAEHSFDLDDVQPPKRWPNLRCLFLTSQLLAPDRDETRIADMLRAAARAAAHMPKLEALKIWNGRKDLAALFKYEAATEQGQASTITWKGTWVLHLQAPVIRAWQFLASEPSQQLRVVYESIASDQVRCHGDAMVLLELPQMVIRHVSLRQILNEQLYIPLTVRSSHTSS
ncbi:hypothetical protein HDV57DRAFT_508059 [Trichoderma longibrachiatum]